LWRGCDEYSRATKSLEAAKLRSHEADAVISLSHRFPKAPEHVAAIAS
jgi:hypothetical protein